ncbi:MAG: tetratricopeptide repeat protein [Gemmatimonadota bacterium]
MKGVGSGWKVRAPALTAAVLASLASAVGAKAQESTASSGRARVLVAPLHTEGSVKADFGRKIADEVRDDLKDFPSLTSVDRKELRDELKRLKLDEKELGLIQWRQLASRLNAQVVMYGTIVPAAGGNAVSVTFVDARTGDELKVPEFRVGGDGRDEVKEAAARIYEAFEGQVQFLQAVVFCRDYLAADQLEDALRNCNRALELNPESGEALYLRGRIRMKQEDWNAAREDLDVVVAQNAAKTDALQSLAYTYAQLGEVERATELYREYLNFNPADADVRLKVAFDLAKAGGYDAAIALLEEGIERDATNAALWEYLGNVALTKGTQAEEGEPGSSATGNGEAAIADPEAVRLAIRAYSEVLTLKGDSIDPNILKNVMAAHLNMGEFEQALQFGERAQAMMPNDPGLWSIRADVLGRMDRFSEAVAALDRVLELDPEYENARLRRGLFRLRSGDREGAVVDLRSAVERGTDSNLVAGQLFARGYSDYFQKGRYETAISMFRVALEFATTGEVKNQINFFTAYGYFQQGVAIDRSNEANEACEPARRALEKFQQVIPNLNRAGNYQAKSQGQIRENTDVYLFRQEQIIKKACR